MPSVPWQLLPGSRDSRGHSGPPGLVPAHAPPSGLPLACGRVLAPTAVGDAGAESAQRFALGGLSRACSGAAFDGACPPSCGGSVCSPPGSGLVLQRRGLGLLRGPRVLSPGQCRPEGPLRGCSPGSSQQPRATSWAASEGTEAQRSSPLPKAWGGRAAELETSLRFWGLCCRTGVVGAPRGPHFPSSRAVREVGGGWPQDVAGALGQGGRVTHRLGGDRGQGSALGPNSVPSGWRPGLRAGGGASSGFGGRRGAVAPLTPSTSTHSRASVRPDLVTLQELLAEWQLQRGRRSVCEQLRRAAVLAFVWLLCLGTTFGCTVAVYAFSELTIKVQGQGGGPRGGSGRGTRVPLLWTRSPATSIHSAPAPCLGAGVGWGGGPLPQALLSLALLTLFPIFFLFVFSLLVWLFFLRRL